MSSKALQTNSFCQLLLSEVERKASTGPRIWNVAKSTSKYNKSNDHMWLAKGNL